MSYLVWAVFAAAFAGIVVVVTSTFLKPVSALTLKEVKTVFIGAYQAAQTNLSCTCVSANGDVAFPSGFALDTSVVRLCLCNSGSCVNVRFVAGPGFRLRNGNNQIVAVRAVHGKFTVCCDLTRCTGYFNDVSGHSC